MIQVENLTKLYGSTLSLAGVSFEVPEGEVLGFLGPNGAGKSTTMRILTGLARATSGSARICGFDVQKDHREIRKVLGYLPEDAPVYDEMIVEDYLRHMAGMKLLDAKIITKEVDRVVGEVNLHTSRRRVIGNLSKGTRQRVGLAQALLGDPRIVILDEPTVGLDPTQITEVRNLIGAMRGKRTVIFSTHILHNVSVACSRVVILNKGRIIAQGPMDEIGRGDGGRQVEIAFTGDADRTIDYVTTRLKRIVLDHRKPVDSDLHQVVVRWQSKEDFRPELARLIVESGAGLLELKERRATLEDIFLAAISEAEAPAEVSA